MLVIALGAGHVHFDRKAPFGIGIERVALLPCVIFLHINAWPSSFLPAVAQTHACISHGHTIVGECLSLQGDVSGGPWGVSLLLHVHLEGGPLVFLHTEGATAACSLHSDAEEAGQLALGQLQGVHCHAHAVGGDVMCAHQLIVGIMVGQCQFLTLGRVGTVGRSGKCQGSRVYLLPGAVDAAVGIQPYGFHFCVGGGLQDGIIAVHALGLHGAVGALPQPYVGGHLLAVGQTYFHITPGRGDGRLQGGGVAVAIVGEGYVHATLGRTRGDVHHLQPQSVAWQVEGNEGH